MYGVQSLWRLTLLPRTPCRKHNYILEIGHRPFFGGISAQQRVWPSHVIKGDGNQQDKKSKSSPRWSLKMPKLISKHDPTTSWTFFGQFRGSMLAFWTLTILDLISVFLDGPFEHHFGIFFSQVWPIFGIF